RAQFHQTRDLGAAPSTPFVVGCPSWPAYVQVEVDPVRDDFRLRDPLEKASWTGPIRVDHGTGRGPLTLGNPLRLQEVRPRGKSRWWVLLLVMERRGPEGRQSVRIRAVEDDLNAGGHGANITSACGSRPGRARP